MYSLGGCWQSCFSGQACYKREGHIHHWGGATWQLLMWAQLSWRRFFQSGELKKSVAKCVMKNLKKGQHSPLFINLCNLALKDISRVEIFELYLIGKSRLSSSLISYTFYFYKMLTTGLSALAVLEAWRVPLLDSSDDQQSIYTLSYSYEVLMVIKSLYKVLWFL